MLLIPISLLIAACAVHFGAFRILLIAVFFAFCNLSISSTFMSITSAPYCTLGSTTPFQYVFPIITRWQLFLMTVCQHAQSFFFYYFILLSFKHISFCACTITLKYFISSTTSILLIFSHFSFMLNRMHWLFRSLSWRPYFPPISLIISMLLSAFSLSFANINPSYA